MRVRGFFSFSMVFFKFCSEINLNNDNFQNILHCIEIEWECVCECFDIAICVSLKWKKRNVVYKKNVRNVFYIQHTAEHWLRSTRQSEKNDYFPECKDPICIYVRNSVIYVQTFFHIFLEFFLYIFCVWCAVFLWPFACVQCSVFTSLLSVCT